MADLKQSSPLSILVPPELFPDNLFQSDGNILNQIYFLDFGYIYGDESFHLYLDLAIPEIVEFALFGFESVRLALGGGDSTFEVNVTWTNDDFAVDIEGIDLGILFSRELLIPAVRADDGTIQEVPGEERAGVVFNCRIHLDKDFDFQVNGFDALDLPLVKIPNTDSLFLEIKGAKFDLSKTSAIPEITAAGFDESFQGFFAEKVVVHFGGELGEFLPSIEAINFAIGSEGISGKITASFDLEYDAQQKRFSGDAAGTLFGMQIGLRKFSLEFVANEIVSSEIQGQMILPFFKEDPIEIDLGFDLKGNIEITLQGVGGADLVKLTKENMFDLSVNSFSFKKAEDEMKFSLGGKIIPLFDQSNDWPTVEVEELSLGKKGSGIWEMSVKGAEVDLPNPLSFTVSGFHGELRKIGFGTEEGKKFIAFSGSICFVGGIGLEGVFDRLQLFYDPQFGVSIQSVYVGLHIPKALSFEGEATLRDNGFGASLDLTLLPLDIRIFGGAEFGQEATFTYMQVFLGLELPPPGIILGSTPLAIRGFEGKFALNMKPSMKPGWEWAIAPPRGITPLSKLVPSEGGKMFAAGIKITTTDGTILVVNALFALFLPGPVLMIEGRGMVLAHILGGDDQADPPFYALMTLDLSEKYFAANLAYNLDLAKGIVKVNGTVENFFDLEDPTNFYIRMGQKDPRSKRTHAVVLKLFEATAYFEFFSGPHILLGSDIEFKKKIDFKVGHIKIHLYIGGGVEMAWKPEHLSGYLSFLGEIGVKVCGFGLDIGASGDIAAKCPYPRKLYLLLTYRFVLNLPWPLPDVKKSGKFEKTWEDGAPYPCSFDPLISEVAVDSEIPGIPAQKLESPTGELDLEKVAVVPLDARPTILFKYPMNDDTPEDLPFVRNQSRGLILHKIGEDSYRFSLRKIRLETAPIEEGVPIEELNWEDVNLPYGVWVDDQSMTGSSGATTLRLFASTPFTYFSQIRFSADLAASGYRSLERIEEQNEGRTPQKLAADYRKYHPNYLGHEEEDWQYFGFQDRQIQLNVRILEKESEWVLRATEEEWFDLLPLYGEGLSIKGVMFQGKISVGFFFPVTECRLYCWPARQERSAKDFPDLKELGDPGKVFLATERTPLQDVQNRPPQLEVQREGRALQLQSQIEIRGEIVEIALSSPSGWFDLVTIKNLLENDSLFLFAVGYVPYKEKENYASPEDSLFPKEPPVLKPKSLHRLTVTTHLQGGNCDPHEMEKVYFFRTEGPPAEHLKHYVAWANPALKEYPLYRDYTVAIRFNVNYARSLFEDLRLALRLQDEKGNKAEKELEWMSEKGHLIRPEERAYIDLIHPTVPIDPAAIPGDHSLLCAHQGSFEGQTMYRATVFLDSKEGYRSVFLENAQKQFLRYPTLVGSQVSMRYGEEVSVKKEESEPLLFEFSFKTSQFRNFREIFSSFEMQELEVAGEVNFNSLLETYANRWLPERLTLRDKELLVKQRLAEEEELFALKDRFSEAEQELDLAFEAALPGVEDLLLQPRPSQPKFYRSPKCLLFRFPEPIERARVRVEYDPFEVEMVCSANECHWLIFPRDRGNEFSQGTLHLEYLLDLMPSLPRLYYQRGGGLLEKEEIDLPLS